MTVTQCVGKVNVGGEEEVPLNSLGMGPIVSTELVQACATLS